MVRNEPRWQRYQYTREESPPAKWIIESRFQHSDGSMSEWTREAEFASPASYALKRLREIRDRHALADEDFAPKWGQTEVRIRRERNQR